MCFCVARYRSEAEPRVAATAAAMGATTMPIVAALAIALEPLLERRRGGLVFRRTPKQPFSPAPLHQGARRTWRVHGLLHECRHTFASLMIAAGVNAAALQTFMGHASITITLDRYGHLLPGAEDEAAALLDAFLERSRRSPSLRSHLDFVDLRSRDVLD